MLLLLDRRIKILFIIVSLFIFKGCGVSDSITSEYYNKTFGEREEIECPEIKIIKELGELYKENKSEELNYLVKFNSISWNCYTEYSDASSEEDSLVDELFGDEIHDNFNLFTTILLQVSFVVTVEENMKIREGEKEWVPLMLVIGEKEVKTEKYPIRMRKGNDFSASIEEIIETMMKMQENEPQRSLPLPERMSLRSKFRG